jgi:hypothetical protein
MSISHLTWPTFGQLDISSEIAGLHVPDDDVEPVDVEQLSLGEARMVLARAESELARAYNSAHAASLRQEIAEVEGQMDWLEAEAAEAELEDAAAEHAMNLWADSSH